VNESPDYPLFLQKTTFRVSYLPETADEFCSTVIILIRTNIILKKVLSSIDVIFFVVWFQLLGELLLDRHNFSIMTRYISNPDNLKLMMNMLKVKSRNIQFEAFHVFKVGSFGLNEAQTATCE
jgi:hypothetical protein